MPRAALLPFLFLFVACSAAPPPPPAPVETLTGQCATPRPQVCTMEYDPVCGQLASGERSDYSSACNACAHDAVVSYLKGACEQVNASAAAEWRQ